MSEEKQGFFARLFNNRANTAREEKSIDYIIHRMNEGEQLKNIVDEEYIRRNLSTSQTEKVLGDSRIVEAAREHMQEEFLSGRDSLK